MYILLLLLLIATYLSLNGVLTNVYAEEIDRVDPISISDIDASLINAATQYKKTLAHLSRQSSITKSSSGTALLYPRSWVKNEIKLGIYLSTSNHIFLFLFLSM